MVEDPESYGSEESVEGISGVCGVSSGGTFKEATPVVKFLKEEAISVFVVEDWKGISMTGPRTSIQKDSGSYSAFFQAVIHEDEGLLLSAFNIAYYISDCGSTEKLPPYIRICGDYRGINQWVKTFNYPIPDVIKELHKALTYSIVVDLDVTNAFHEIPIDP